MTRRGNRARQATQCIGLVMALSACGNGDAQQNSSKGSIVQSAVLRTSGDISGDFRPLDISAAQIQGGCDDDAFANFGLIYETRDWRRISVTVMTKDGIASGQVGPIALDWALVSFMDSSYDATQFRGPAEFVISTNDATEPRMTATVKGTLAGYGGLLDDQALADKAIDFEFTFEIAASCGAAG